MTVNQVIKYRIFKTKKEIKTEVLKTNKENL